MSLLLSMATLDFPLFPSQNTTSQDVGMYFIFWKVNWSFLNLIFLPPPSSVAIMSFVPCINLFTCDSESCALCLCTAVRVIICLFNFQGTASIEDAQHPDCLPPSAYSWELPQCCITGGRMQLPSFSSSSLILSVDRVKSREGKNCWEIWTDSSCNKFSNSSIALWSKNHKIGRRVCFVLSMWQTTLEKYHSASCLFPFTFL